MLALLVQSAHLFYLIFGKDVIHLYARVGERHFPVVQSAEHLNSSVVLQLGKDFLDAFFYAQIVIGLTGMLQE